MINKERLSLLEQLEGGLNIDADTLNADFISKLPIQAHDVTSNQRFVHEALISPINKDVVERTVRELKGAPWEDVYAVCIARFGKNVLPLISGRLLAQTSPSGDHPYDEEYVFQNAKRLAKAWNDEGITNDRFCVKLATTSAGVRAAKRLKAEGISTLGTTLFSVPQAVAAYQAGMYAISMYFNDPCAHTDPTVWPDVADPNIEHPMAYRHHRIREHYDSLIAAGKQVPQMKTASFVSPYEALAMVELGADHITIGLPLLNDLQTFHNIPPHQKGLWKKSISDYPGISDGDWSPLNWCRSAGEAQERRAKVLAAGDPLSSVELSQDDLDKDYLAPGVLDEVNAADTVSRERLAEGLKRFSLMETESKIFIENLQATIV